MITEYAILSISTRILLGSIYGGSAEKKKTKLITQLTFYFKKILPRITPKLLIKLESTVLTEVTAVNSLSTCVVSRQRHSLLSSHEHSLTFIPDCSKKEPAADYLALGGKVSQNISTVCRRQLDVSTANAFRIFSIFNEAVCKQINTVT